MTTIDKRAAIAALGGPEKARYMIERVCNGDRFRDAGRASSAVRALALSALEADDGRALLRRLQKIMHKECGVREQHGDKRAWTDANRFMDDVIDRLLAAEPAQSAEPAVNPTNGPGKTTAACDWPEDAGQENGSYLCKCVVCGVQFTGHKRRGVCKVCSTKPAEPAQIAEPAVTAASVPTQNVTGSRPPEPAAPAPADSHEKLMADLHAMDPEQRHDWVRQFNAKDPAGDDEARIAEWYHQAAHKRGAYIDDGRALMRSLLARAVEAERGYARCKSGADEAWSKLAAAEKARDAAIAAQNARAVEELASEEAGYIAAAARWQASADNASDQHERDRLESRVCQLRGVAASIRRRIAALRSSPPAAPAGEAPAGDDDTLRRFLRREDIPCGGERLLSVVADLCRRELARGER